MLYFTVLGASDASFGNTQMKPQPGIYYRLSSFMMSLRLIQYTPHGVSNMDVAQNPWGGRQQYQYKGNQITSLRIKMASFVEYSCVDLLVCFLTHHFEMSLFSSAQIFKENITVCHEQSFWLYAFSILCFLNSHLLPSLERSLSFSYQVLSNVLTFYSLFCFIRFKNPTSFCSLLRTNTSCSLFPL